MEHTVWIAVDVISGIGFFASVVFLWRSLRGPLRSAFSLPHEAAMEQYRESAGRGAAWTAVAKPFFEEVRFRASFARRRARFLYRIHIMLLRLDNRLLARYNRLKNTGTDEEGDEV